MPETKSDISKEYTVSVGNLKVSGSAEDIHELALIYETAACEIGHQIVDEIHNKSKNHDDRMSELLNTQKRYSGFSKQLINTIRNSEYYKQYSSNLSDIIDSILEEILEEELKEKK